MLALIVVTVAALAAPAAGGPKLKTLGTDAEGDGPPALDITYLEVRSTKEKLEIRIGVAGMLPMIGGYPELPGIEWIFDVKKRTFIAEGVARRSGPEFFLFEDKGDSFEQLASPEGTYDPDDGYISILVPLDVIGAASGTKISGVGKKGTEDVDAHVHLGPETHYPDRMATTKDYVIP